MRAALFLVVPALVSFALIQLGFRILYDSVIPEVAGLVIAGAAFALAKPRWSWLSLIGLCAGVFVSETVVPVPAPAAHVAQYGASHALGLAGLLRLAAFPTGGAVVGLISSFMFRQS